MSKKPEIKVMKNNIWVIAVSFLILIVVCIAMWWKMQDIIDVQMEHQVAQQGKALSGIVNNSFGEELQLLSDITALIDMETGKLKDILKEEEGVSYGVLRINGEATYGEALDVSEYDGIVESLHGNDAVSCGDDSSVLFTVPVYSGENVKYVLYKLYDGDVLAEKLDISCYDGEGVCAVIDINGQILLQMEDAPLDSALFYAEDSVKAYASIRDKMNINSAAASVCKVEGDNRVLFASETEYSGVYITGWVPEEAVAGDIDLLIPLVLWCFGLLWLLLVIVTIYLLGAEKKARESDELRQAKQIAEEANSAKTNFLANMSHEIRTTINAVIGMNEMIIRESTDEAILEYAGNIDIAGHSLLSIINDILDFSKIESGKMEIVCEEYKLGELLNDVVTMMELKAKQKNLGFEVDVCSDLPEVLYGDDMRIKQILLNLLNNAVKYTSAGKVGLNIKGEKDEAAESINLIMEIKDTGIGIREEDIEGLFKHFQRLDLETNRDIEGTGLGLAITHNLVKMMGGEIKVQSVYGEGSTFTVYLPQSIRGKECLGDFVKNYRNSAGRLKKYANAYVAPDASVLVVDDNQINLQVVKNLLKKTRLNITTCMSGKQALELMCKNRYDVILLDHMMPGMDGIQTLKKSKEMPENKNSDIAVIALTANAVSGAKEMYLEAGFSDYVSKPIVGTILEEKIAKYLPEEKIILTEEETKTETQETVPVLPTQDEAGLIDYETGKKYCGDSLEMYAEILKMFCQQYEKKKADLERFLNEKNWNDYTVLIHSTKTNALNIGSKSLADKCLELEKAGKSIREGVDKESNIAFISEHHEDAMNMYSKVMREAKEFLAKQEG